MKENRNLSKYYDLHKTLSFDALFTMIITSRGRGKTYGVRKQSIKDHIKDGSTFAEICRFKDEIKNIKNGYFDKIILNNEFPDYEFKIEGNKGFIAKKIVNNEQNKKKNKLNWEFLCGFYALSEYQNIKKRTHVNLKRVIFDEAIIEKLDRYHTYFNNEYDILLNIVDSLSREDAHNEKIKVRIYLLANACDLINPYFIKFGINDIPKFGYSWYKNKNVLLHYEDPKEYAILKEQNTLVGKLSSNEVQETANKNVFIQKGKEFIISKPKNAKFSFGIKVREKNFGVWIDYVNGYIVIDKKIPNGNNNTVYTLFREDNTLNTISATRANTALNSLKQFYYDGLIRYTSYSIMENFKYVFDILGIR